jgi:hypothetical protein
MEHIIKCECGCELFTQARPSKYTVEGFRVWRIKADVEVAESGVPIIKCISCGRVKAPQSSFPGKNVLDPEVKLYAELHDTVSRKNTSLRDTDAIIKGLFDRLLKLEAKLTDLEVVTLTEEAEADVKATGRSKKIT